MQTFKYQQVESFVCIGLFVGLFVFHHLVQDVVNVYLLLAGGFLTTVFQLFNQFVDFLFGELAGYFLA